MTRPSFLEAARALSESGAEQLSAVLEKVPFGVYIDHPTRGCTYVNPALMEMYGHGWESLRGFGWAHYVLEGDVDHLQRAIHKFEHTRSSIDITFRIRASEDAPIRWLNARVEAVVGEQQEHLGSIGIVQDITSEIERAERRDEEQKLEAVGQLSARLAHDFNNLLTAIIGNTELLALDIESESGQERLHSLNLIFDQAQNLTSQLLTISSRDIYQPSTLELDSELARLVSLLKTTVGAGVHLELQFSAAGSHVPLNFSQLGQILINLTSNARDAVGGKGHVVVCTKADATRAYITVRDDGDGMTLPTIQRAFEPFFTTKEKGRGTGLGLATVQSIVEFVRGEVTISSEPNHGTTVTVALPLVNPLPDSIKLGATETPRVVPGTVLLVEDDDAVRQSLSYALALVGYEVVAAASVAEARQRVAQVSHLDVVVCDIMLPDGLGTDLLKELRAQWPDLPVVFNSGFTAGATEQMSTLDRKNSLFVAKPFRAREIVDAIATLTRPPVEG